MCHSQYIERRGCVFGRIAWSQRNTETWAKSLPVKIGNEEKSFNIRTTHTCRLDVFDALNDVSVHSSLMPDLIVAQKHDVGGVCLLNTN